MDIANLPTDLSRKYRISINHEFRFGAWRHDYRLIGSLGGMNLHIAGPHKFNGIESWSSGLERHERMPQGDRAPDHDLCWLLQCPCWHDGTSLYAEEKYLPMFLAGDHEAILRQLIFDADRHWGNAAYGVEA